MISSLVAKYKWKDALRFRSLYLFSKTSKVRRFAHTIASSVIFEYFILISIVLSVVVIATHKPNKNDLGDPMVILDFSLNVVFGVEAILKIISYGFFMHKGAYLRNKWNVFDFFVVLSGSISDILTLSNCMNTTISIKFLRIFRVLRPLRLIFKLDSLRVIMVTLIKSFGSLLHVLLFILLIIVLFAIGGMELFGGLLHNICADKVSKEMSGPIPTFCSPSIPDGCSQFNNSSCQEIWPGFDSDLSSFDHIFVAIVTVVQVITLEDWVFLTYPLTKVTSPVITWIYFISLVLLGGYFAIDLLTGVLGNQYLRTNEFSKKLQDVRRAHEKKRLELSTMTNVKGLQGLANQNSSTSTDQIKQRLKTAYHQIRFKCSNVVKLQAFFWSMKAVTLVDVCITTVFAHLTDKSRNYIYIKAFLLVLYFIESAIIWIGKGSRVWKKGYFVLQTIVVFVAVIEMILSLQKVVGIFIGTTVIRAVTLIRVFKHTRFWPQFKSMINSFVESMKAVTSMLLLLFIVVLNYALIGNQLFGNCLTIPGGLGTFCDFGNSLLLSFVLLTGDNWVSLMVESTKQFDTPFFKILSILYFLSFVVVGNFILINLFLGIIVENLTSQYEENTKENTAEKQQRFQKIALKTIGLFGTFHKPQNGSVNNEIQSRPDKTANTGISLLCCCRPPRKIESETIASVKDSNDCYVATTPAVPIAKDNFSILKNLSVHKSKNVQFACSIQSCSQLPFMTVAPEKQLPSFRTKKLSVFSAIKAQGTSRIRAWTILVDPELSNPISKHKSLFLFDHNNKFRRKVFFMVTSSYFTIIIYLTIILSSLTMAFYDPLNMKTNTITQGAEFLFVGIFTAEIILKSIAYGFLFGHQTCYLRDPMNLIDALVVCVSYVNIWAWITGSTNQIDLRVLRVLRVIRLLKISSQLRRVINCLFTSFHKIAYFLVVYFLILFLYSIFGMYLYRGLLGQCEDPQFIKKTDCLNENFLWSSDPLAFDHLGISLSTLFVLSTQDEWFLFLKRLMLLKDTNSMNAVLFVISYILIMSFVTMNVFIGFIIVIFHREKEKELMFKVLDKTSQELITAALTETPVKTNFKDLSGSRKKLHFIISTTWFQTTSMALIIINTVILMTKTYGQGELLTSFQKYSNIVLTVCFTVEIILRFLGTPFCSFVHDPWMIFDTIVVVGSWIDIILSELGMTAFLSLSFCRLFRVARLGKFAGAGRNLQQLFATLLKSMKSVPAISLLLGIILFVYAIIGMEFFGNIRLESVTPINENTNFQTFTQAALVLVRVATLDTWHEIMLACADVESNNCQTMSGNCGSYFSYIFFVSFVFLCSFILTNLFLAFIMENFVYLTNDIAVCDCRHIYQFTKTWRRFDIEETGEISLSQLVDLLKVMEPPLGVGIFCPQRTVFSKIMRLKVPIDETRKVIRFNELLLLLVLDSLKLSDSNEAIRDDIHHLAQNIDDELLDKVLPVSYDPRIFNQTEIQFYEQCAAYVISGHYRNYKSGARVIQNIFPAKDYLLKNIYKLSYAVSPIVLPPMLSKDAETENLSIPAEHSDLEDNQYNKSVYEASTC